MTKLWFKIVRVIVGVLVGCVWIAVGLLVVQAVRFVAPVMTTCATVPTSAWPKDAGCKP